MKINWLYKPTPIYPLVIFRIGFGVLMFVSTLRFMLKGWVQQIYIDPQFHFTYYGFGWVKPLPGIGMYLVFGILLILTIGITTGLFYRFCMTAYFILFTYVELLDKAYYLNHYYFVSLLSFLLIFLPLHRKFSLDVIRHPHLKTEWVPRWTVFIVQLQLGIVYFFAGVAKLKPDWLFHAMPLAIWLRANTEFPILGRFFDELWMHYGMSWVGAIYDLTIPFWLAWWRTRPFAYIAVIGFHVITGMLFPIGMFPWVMIVCTLIFFSVDDYQCLGRLLPINQKLWHKSLVEEPLHPTFTHAEITSENTIVPIRRLVWVGFGIFFVFQILFPLRHWLYPGNVMWTEEGYRFSWNVMLAEKNGLALFHVTDSITGQEWTVFPSEYLTRQQEHQMSFQPDMILQFAHFLEDEFHKAGYTDVSVTVESYVSLNGRSSKPLIDPNADLTHYQNTVLPKPWITSLH